MHFGKRLENDLVERWRPHYLQYKLLKKYIKEMEERANATTANTADAAVEGKQDASAANGLVVNRQISYQEFSFPGPKSHRYAVLNAFKPLLDRQIETVNAFVTSKVQEVQNRILQLLRTPVATKPSSAESSASPSSAEVRGDRAHDAIQQLAAEADVIAQDLADLDKFIRQNCIAVQKIVKKFDKHLKFNVSPWLNSQLLEEPFVLINMDALLIALSDAYERITALKSEHNMLNGGISPNAAPKGISAQSFERKTTKYWVRAEHLMSVKIAILKVPYSFFDC
jgi:SPX domain protein involved in polyphosphate accumulation